MFVARHGANPGDSISRTADAILRDRGRFEHYYRQAARRIASAPFATLVQTYYVLGGYHDRQGHPPTHRPEEP